MNPWSRPEVEGKRCPGQNSTISPRLNSSTGLRGTPLLSNVRARNGPGRGRSRPFREISLSSEGFNPIGWSRGITTQPHGLRLLSVVLVDRQGICGGQGTMGRSWAIPTRRKWSHASGIYYKFPSQARIPWGKDSGYRLTLLVYTKGASARFRNLSLAYSVSPRMDSC